MILFKWFCLNALWKVKNSHEKKFMRKRKSCSLKIKISKVLLCFKDKESDENVLFWSKGSLSRVLEWVSFSFECIDSKIRNLMFSFVVLCILGSNESCVP